MGIFNFNYRIIEYRVADGMVAAQVTGLLSLFSLVKPTTSPQTRQRTCYKVLSDSLHSLSSLSPPHPVCLPLTPAPSFSLSPSPSVSLSPSHPRSLCLSLSGILASCPFHHESSADVVNFRTQRLRVVAREERIKAVFSFFPPGKYFVRRGKAHSRVAARV